MLINLSNHSSSLWDKNQTNEAEKSFGSIVDLAFPAVPPEADILFIKNLVNEYFDKCMNLLNAKLDENNAMHIMGEMTFSFALVNKLIKNGILCLASTTERNSDEFNGAKLSKFKFVRFREYSF